MQKFLLFTIIILSTFLSSSPLLAQCGSAGGIIINEIDYNPATDDDNLEFIEFLNTSDAAIDVSGWTFTDSEFTYTFPTPTTIGPGEFYVIENGAMGTVLNSDDVFGTTTAQLSNGGEAVTLADAGGTTIDEVTYNDTNGWDDGNCGTAGDADGGGQSLQVMDPCADNSVQDNWTACDPTPGESNILAMLPIVFGKVETRKVNDNIEILWETLSETNNQYFDIQWSIDGRAFQSIGDIAGAGYSSRTINYSFTHKNPSSGINFYKIKQVDFDGAFAYSEVIVTSLNNAEANLVLTPSPVQDDLYINSNDIISLDIFSMTGQRVASYKNLDNGVVNVSDLQSGAYVVRIKLENKTITKKVIKL